MVVYVDILLFVNTIINYVILMTAEKLMKRDCRLYRILSGAFIGALFSLVIFIRIDNRIFLFLIKIISGGVITVVTFGVKSRSEYIKMYIANILISLVYSGFFVLFYQIVRPPNMIIVNDIIYLQINPVMLMLFTGVIYAIILGLYKLFSIRIKNTVATVYFSIQEKDCRCIGKIDTGCNLREPFSSAPVIIVDSSVYEIDEKLPHRIIPYSTVGGSSFLHAVKAQKVIINKKTITQEIYIASTSLQDPHYQAIINSEIIR